MRVLHLLDNLAAGGAQRVALALSDWQARNGHAVTMLSRPGELVKHVPSSVRLIEAPRSFVQYSLTALQLTAKLKPHVIHSHQRPEALIGWSLSKLYRCIAVEHAHTVLADRSKRALSFRSAHIFAVSEAVQNMITEEFGRPSARVSLVRNRPALSTAAAKVSRDDDSGVVHVVGVGRLTPQKDPLRFVEVISELSKYFPVKATWVGDGPLLAECKELAERLDAGVDYVGFQADVTPFIDSATLVLMTSRWEGMPLTALETLARGRVLVAPRTDGLSELVAEGAFGLGFEVDASAKEIAGLVRTALNTEDWKRWSDQGPTLIAEKFGEEDAYGPVERMYRHLVNGAPL